MNRLSLEEIAEIREELEFVEYLPHGFYMYPEDGFRLTVVAQGPLDRYHIQEVMSSIEGVSVKLGIELFFLQKIDAPTAEQRKGLIPSRALDDAGASLFWL